MNLDSVKAGMIKGAVAAVYQVTAGMVSDISSASQEREIIALASELSDNILAFKFPAESAQPSEQPESAQTTSVVHRRL
jgi:hypothetical protein